MTLTVLSLTATSSPSCLSLYLASLVHLLAVRSGLRRLPLPLWIRSPVHPCSAPGRQTREDRISSPLPWVFQGGDTRGGRWQERRGWKENEVARAPALLGGPPGVPGATASPYLLRRVGVMALYCFQPHDSSPLTGFPRP